MGIAMALPNNFTKVLETHLELAAELLDHASILKQKVDSIESDKAVAELNNKLILIKAREKWANAEVRAYRALRNNVKTAEMAYDIQGKPVVDVVVNFSIHIPADWERIWKQVADKLHKYRKNLVLQYAYGQNPSEISGSASHIQQYNSKGLTAVIKDEDEHSLKYAQGMTFMDGSVAFMSVKIGNHIWLSKNLAIDDGGEGIFRNPENNEYYYTWDAAVRVTQAIPGWHLPSVDEWDEAFKACGVEPFEDTGQVDGTRKLYDRLKVLLAGGYSGSFLGIGSIARFWTITASGSHAYYRYFDKCDTTGQLTDFKSYGYSVRLVKDDLTKTENT